VSGEENLQDAEIEEVSSRLNEGLKTCRSVVVNYRSLLAREGIEVPANDDSPDPPYSFENGPEGK
jgi:hypothetical protein